MSSSQDLDLVFWAKNSHKKLTSLKVIFYQQMQLGVLKKNFYQKWKLNCIDFWIAPLPWLKEELLIKSTINSQKVTVIPLCLDTKSFIQQIQSVDRQSFFSQYQIAPDTFLFGIIGRIDPGLSLIHI